MNLILLENVVSLGCVYVCVCACVCEKVQNIPHHVDLIENQYFIGQDLYMYNYLVLLALSYD